MEDKLPPTQDSVNKSTELQENADYRGIAGKASLNEIDEQVSLEQIQQETGNDIETP